MKNIKELGKENRVISKESRRKKIIRAEISEVENGQIMEKINKFKSCFLERAIKVMNP